MFYKINENNEIIETCTINYDDKFLETDKNIIVGFDNKLYFEDYTKTDEYILMQKNYNSKQELDSLRATRDVECFPIINRGSLWYDTLTDGQKEELKTWYKAWLDVTETKIVPEKPKWL